MFPFPRVNSQSLHAKCYMRQGKILIMLNLYCQWRKKHRGQSDLQTNQVNQFSVPVYCLLPFQLVLPLRLKKHEYFLLDYKRRNSITLLNMTESIVSQTSPVSLVSFFLPLSLFLLPYLSLFLSPSSFSLALEDSRFFLKIYSFIFLCWVLAVACGTFDLCCSVRDLVP